MRTLSTPELLRVWERGQTQNMVQRGLALLAIAQPEADLAELARLSIGQRDAQLLRLRERLFGPQMASMATCPACSARLEITFNTTDLLLTPTTGNDELCELRLEGYELLFRLPNSNDLQALAELEERPASREILLQRCLLRTHWCGEEKSPAELPAQVVDAVVAKMAQQDPQADVQLEVACVSCDHRWRASFDIVSFLWLEIQTWAQRLLHEVHVLASAYGWREADILTMSPWRRHYYLSMVRR